MSPGVDEPTPGALVLPEEELEPDCPLAGAPESDPLFRPLDWPVEALLEAAP